MNPAIRRIAFLASAAASLLLATLPVKLSAQTASFEDGLAAYKAGRNQDAQRIWMPLAQGGDPLAQYSLGKLYETGRGGAPDFEAAARWYALAAQQDMAAAQNNLGLMYAQGRGVPRDPVRAAQLWSRSANASNPMAQYNLGLAYFRGEGVGQDQVEAAVWFHLAADAGVSEAQFALGQMHRLGLALPQDDRRALHWYQRAAKKGHGDAQVQAKRLQAQGILASQPLDVMPPDPLEQAGPETKSAAAATTQTAGKPNLVQGGGAQEDVTQEDVAQENVARASGKGAAQTPASPASAAAARLAQPATQSDQGGFQLQSKLIAPKATRKPNADKAEGNAPASEVKADGQGAVKTVARSGQQPQVARREAVEPLARTPQTSSAGTFLWLLSSANEAQAEDLLKEAERDYAAALGSQKLSLMREPASGTGTFYRLVVAAESQADAAATCEKIREINAEAFCSILER